MNHPRQATFNIRKDCMGMARRRPLRAKAGAWPGPGMFAPGWRLGLLRTVLLTVLLGVLPMLAVAAVSCADLDDEAKIRAFLERSRAATPLWRDQMSVYLEVSPCEGEVCGQAQRKQRIALIQQLHFLRTGEDRRAFVLRGPYAPQCLVSRGERDVLCARCDGGTNANCRSVVRKEGSGRIPNTNIDLTDWENLSGDAYTARCTPSPGAEGMLELEFRAKAPGAVYGRVVAVVEAGRGVPLLINLYAEDVLRKVYRFFENYYVQVGGEWVSTIMRVRSTQGDEKHYLYETQIRVLPGEDKQPRLYFNPQDDPSLKAFNLNKLFFTN